MSIQIKFICNGNNCNNFFYPDEDPFDYEKEMLQENGWTKDEGNGLHYCENCSNKLKEK